MRKRRIQKRVRWLAGLRFPLLLFTGVVGLAWISSYFIGVQRYRSDWEVTETSMFEEARWVVSNFGSIGFAWRKQAGALGSPVPSDESEWKVFRSSSSVLKNMHPEGFLPWHWVHYRTSKHKMMGAMHTDYGHLYFPYWLPFAASGLCALFLSGYFARERTH